MEPNGFILMLKPNNEHALGLYTSCGFTVKGTFDYYRIDLDEN